MLEVDPDGVRRPPCCVDSVLDAEVFAGVLLVLFAGRLRMFCRRPPGLCASAADRSPLHRDRFPLSDTLPSCGIPQVRQGLLLDIGFTTTWLQ